MKKAASLLAAPLLAALLLALGQYLLAEAAPARHSAQARRPAAPSAASPAAALAPINPITNPLFVGVDEGTVPAYRLEPATSVSNSVFSGVPVWGAAFDPAGNRILFTSGITLHVWPVGAGSTYTLGNIVSSVSGFPLVIEGLAFANGTLYGSRVGGAGLDPRGLYSIDPDTLIATLITTYTVPNAVISGLDADPVSGVIYGTNDDAGLRGLVRLDLDGTVTLIAPYPSGQDDIDGLAIGDGHAYLITDEPGVFHVFSFTTLTYTVAITSPWTAAEIFAAGAWIGQPAPVAVVSPHSFTATLLVNTQVTRTLTISNTGSADLHWLIAEQAPAAAQFALAPAASASDGPASAGAASPDQSGPAPAAALARLALPVSGATAYGIDLAGDALVSLVLDSSENLITVTTGVTQSFFAGDFAGDDFQVLFAIDDATGTLHQIDTHLGLITPVGPSAALAGHTWTGMSWDAATNTMYASSSDCAAESALYTLNLATGAATLVGPITNSTCLIDIAVSPAGLMYGLDVHADNLMRIDKATGAGTLIGPVGFSANFAQGMDFDPGTGHLYLAAYQPSFGGALRLADTSSGATAVIGLLGTGGQAQMDAFAIAAPGCPAPSLPWLTLEEPSGVVPPGQAGDILIHFNSTGLLAGDHVGVLCIATDDPANPLAQVPVTLTVEGTGIYLPVVEFNGP